VGALAAVVLIRFGALDFVADDRSVGTAAVESVFTWWAVLSLLILLASATINRPRETALAMASIVVVLVLAELALRVATPDAAKRPLAGLQSSVFHHIYPADVEMFMGRFDDAPVVVRTNEDGLRSDRTRAAFLKYPNRVALLGDSFTLGLGVNGDRTCGAVLERQLSRNTNAELAVLNAGVISYSPILEKQMYERLVSSYRPTVVVLLLDASDIGDDLQYEREALSSDPLAFDLPDESRPRRYSALGQLTEPFFSRVWDNLSYPYYSLVHSGTFDYSYYDFVLDIDGGKERNRFFIYRHSLKHTRVHFERTLGYINALAKRVKADGAQFVLAVTPRYHHWSDRECPDNWEVKQRKYQLNDAHEFVYIRFFEEVAQQVDYPVLNLLPFFEDADRNPLVFSEDPHWNASGHELVGEILAAYLAGSGWIPK